MLQTAFTTAQPKLTKKQQKAASFKASKKSKAPRHHPDDGHLAAMDNHAHDHKDSQQSTSHLDQPTTSSSTHKPAAVAATTTKSENKKSKKRKLDSRDDADAEGLEAADVAQQQKKEDNNEGEPKQDKKSKSSRKEKKSKTSSPTAADASAPALGAKKTMFGEDGTVASESIGQTSSPTTPASSKPSTSHASGAKLILFVGNMPFDLTSADIAKHFGSTCGEEPTVRLLTKKGDPTALQSLSKSKQKSIAKGKAKDPSAPQSKGCAFIEFQSHTAVQKALRFHHTMLAGRQINVELTAGGGGKSAARKEKIAKKNQALEKERQKIHATYVAPAAASHKAKQAAQQQQQQSDSHPSKKRKVDGEGEAQWGRHAAGGGDRAPAAGGRKIPKFAASGANAVRFTSA
ncbi:hypothetical protein ACQY0O_007699 [Thecaphora frezii]